jgi:regulatory protein
MTSTPRLFHGAYGTMRTITEIRAVSRRADRYAVIVDGESVATLSPREISDLKLHVGAELSSAAESGVRLASDRLAAYDQAGSMLARMPRSMFDLARRLRAKGHRPDVVRRALDRLREEGLAGDEAFARQYARSRLSRRVSPAQILNHLLRLGVLRSVAEQAISDVTAAEHWDERGAAAEVAERKGRTLKGLDRLAARRRMIAFLRRRGFSAAAVREAIERFESE